MLAKLSRRRVGFAAVALLSLVAIVPAVRADDPATAPPTIPVGGPTAPPPSSGPVTSVAPGDYRVDIDDTVSISVGRHPDVGGTFRITPDGLIRLQRLTTAIDARGKTAAELTDEVTQKLQTEGKLVLHTGQVVVTVVGLRMRRLYVRGNAVRGGEYDLKDGWRFDDLIAVIGGVPQPDRVTVQLTNPKRSAPIDIDLARALLNPGTPSNVALEEGDTITINSPQMKRLMIKGEGPRGLHDVDERFGIRSALLSLGFTTNGATGDLKHARIIRNATPGDFNSPTTYIPVNVLELMQSDTTPDVAFKDLDTLEIPISNDYVYILGEIGGPRKYYLPQDRPIRLLDIYANAGDVTGNAKMGRVGVTHEVSPSVYGKPESYDLAKLAKTGDMKENPLIQPHDIIYVPSNNRTDPVNSIWTAWGLFSIIKAVIPGLPIP